MLVQPIADISSTVHDGDECVTLCQCVKDIFVKPVQIVLSLSQETIEYAVILNRVAYRFAKELFFLRALAA